VRPSAVYGPFDVNERVVQVFIENALLGHPLRLDDPSARLDFTHVTDTACGIALATLSDSGDSDIFNVTRGQGRSLAELVEVIRKYVPDVVVERGNENPERPKRGTLSMSLPSVGEAMNLRFHRRMGSRNTSRSSKPLESRLR
jgi:UDP-glucose 4-epimerase